MKNKASKTPAAKKTAPAVPARRRTKILTGSGKLVRGWILADGTVTR